MNPFPALTFFLASARRIALSLLLVPDAPPDEIAIAALLLFEARRNGAHPRRNFPWNISPHASFAQGGAAPWIGESEWRDEAAKFIFIVARRSGSKKARFPMKWKRRGNGVPSRFFCENAAGSRQGTPVTMRSHSFLRRGHEECNAAWPDAATDTDAAMRLAFSAAIPARMKKDLSGKAGEAAFLQVESLLRLARQMRISRKIVQF